ncbi:phage late control D family protein [Roseovarius ramblicola]|uniref:Phage late control D family protein n=1 Tax=Roseovarius ramblicola TaxID=2022336 RepID=A0ABV5HYT8_9RHOB
MGLSDWEPAFRVTVDGDNITSLIASRLSALTLTDVAGVESDAVSITLTDHLPLQRLEIPPPGAEIEVALGYRFRLRDMGLYIADSVEVSGPPDMMRISATASVHGQTTGGKTALTEHKTRSWAKGTTLGDLAAKVAGEHGLSPAVSASLAAVALPHIDQIDESDIALLTRLARERDAILKPGGGRIVLARRGESLTTGGAAMPVIELRPRDVTSWRMSRSLRAPAGRVVAVWRDRDAARDVEVVAGEGDPARRLSRRYPDADTARAAADAEFRRSQRAGSQLSVRLPGDPDIVAEARLRLTGFRDGVDGEWLITRAVHDLGNGGYRCSVTAEVPE